MKDFTTEKYRILLTELIDQGYRLFTVFDYLSSMPKSNSIILRHDVDSCPEKALRMALLESELGVKSTFYFRYVKSVFDIEVIKRIQEIGHEIGYHYETLSKSHGNYKAANELFQIELGEFRKICDIKTICMHGSPLSKYDNRDLWKLYSFLEYGIIGEAYLSVGKELNYFSDTGLEWNQKHKIRDWIPDKKEKFEVDSTDDLLKVIDHENLNRVYILVHPEHWAENIPEWYYLLAKNKIKNYIKTGLKELNYY